MKANAARAGSAKDSGSERGGRRDPCDGPEGREDAGTAKAKRLLAERIEREMRRLRISKVEMAERMGTSRSAVNRLLDPSNLSVTLRTLGKAARVLGKRIQAGWS